MKYPAERQRLMAVLPPANRAANAYATGWVSMQSVMEVLAVLKTGAMTATSTVDLILQQATDAAGTGVKAIPGKAITQLTQAGGDGDDVCYINLKAYELDVNGGFDHIRALLTVAAAASYTDLELWGTCLRYTPDAMALITENVA